VFTGPASGVLTGPASGVLAGPASGVLPPASGVGFDAGPQPGRDEARANEQSVAVTRRPIRVCISVLLKLARSSGIEGRRERTPAEVHAPGAGAVSAGDEARQGRGTGR
jgi:hypothetical protein